MKKHTYLLFLMTCLCIGALMSLSFDQIENKSSGNHNLFLEDSTDQTTIEDNHNFSEIWASWREKDTWEEKLDAFVNGKFAKVLQNLSKDRLKLLGYEYVKEVSLKEAIKTTELNKESLIAASSGNNIYLMPFAFLHVPEKEYNNIKNSLIKHFIKIEFLYQKKIKLSHVLLKLVKLNWLYRGKPFSTNCLVSPATQKVVYDIILSNIFTTGNAAHTLTKASGHHSIHRKSCYIFTKELHTPKIESIYGLNQADISFVITGMRTNDGSFKITSVKSNQNVKNKNPFYKSDAECFYKKKGSDENTSYYFSLETSYGRWSNSLTVDSMGISEKGDASISEKTDGVISSSVSAFTNKCEAKY